MQISQAVKRIAGSHYLVAVFSMLAILAIMKLFGAGCTGVFCSPRGYIYAGPLILACTAFGVIGASLSFKFNLFVVKESKTYLPTLALWIVLGQAVAMAYIYFRSAFNHWFFEIEITRLEVWFWVFLAAYILIEQVGFPSLSGRWQRSKFGPFLIQLAVIAVLCVIVADRELPRMVMLSSDPDSHAFFSRQIQRFGGIPYDQHEWGSEAFNYPAGSGVLVYVWSLLGFMDVRNALSALPVLLTLLAALVIAERVLVQSFQMVSQVAVLLFVLALTAAGFILPLYEQYSHMEGTGRQLGIAFSALFLVLCFNSLSVAKTDERSNAIFIAVVVFALAALNPVNLILPYILIAAAVIYILMVERRIPFLVLAPLIGVALLLLDPFFTGMFGLSKVGDVKLELTGGLLIKSPDMWLSDTLGIYQTQLQMLLRHFMALFQWQSSPVFAVLILAFLGSGISLSSKRIPIGRVFLLSVLFVLALMLLDGAATALANDRRFYLLQPYLNFSLGQYKVLLLTFIGAWIAAVLVESKKSVWVIAGVCISLIGLTAVSIRAVQPIRHAPRQAYCGSMGCYVQSDLDLLKQLENMLAKGALAKDDEGSPKILAPNVVGQFGAEKWLFPVASSRALPFYEVLPAAFYYYQADADYTTDAYMQHVCNTFDRDWLKAKMIQYIFLPAERSAACVAGMELLPQSEEIILKVGESYLLKIR